MKGPGLLLRTLGTSLLVAGIALALPSVSRTQEVADAITELDVDHAQRLLDGMNPDSPTVAFERARLALYRGDCDTAAAILTAPAYEQSPQGAELREVARGCTGAVAGAVVVDDDANGVWIRLQDEADRALVPYVTEVAVRSREALGRDLGVDLPRPLRLEVVRDLFSLSAVTGLPVEAAETTGTIAVARWGRVAMVSPRATPHGYAWEDTLAHEITHLVLTRASCDHAPLWLQEGIAKRQETRWRSPRPFDHTGYDEISRAALLAGESIGLDQLGPSIAMLPSAEAARTAYAEVSSFIDFWVAENGEAALRLLLADLRGIGKPDADTAMRGVTGYPLGVWLARWRKALLEPSRKADRVEGGGGGLRPAGPVNYGVRARTRDVVRSVRLGDLLFARGHAEASAAQFDRAVASAASEASVRWRAARARIGMGHPEMAGERLGDLETVDGPSGPWFALRGRLLAESGDGDGAERSYELGIALDPFSEVVACEGHWTAVVLTGESRPPPFLPRVLSRRQLCEAAREFERRD